MSAVAAASAPWRGSGRATAAASNSDLSRVTPGVNLSRRISGNSRCMNGCGMLLRCGRRYSPVHMRIFRAARTHASTVPRCASILATSSGAFSLAHRTILSNFGRSDVRCSAAGTGGWRVGPARGGTWDGVGLCGGCMLVWFVLSCLCAALPYGRTGPTNACFGRTPSPRWDTVRDMGWWHAHRARHGRALCSSDDGGCSHRLARPGRSPPLISHSVAPVGAHMVSLRTIVSCMCVASLGPLRCASSTLRAFLPP